MNIKCFENHLSKGEYGIMFNAQPQVRRDVLLLLERHNIKYVDCTIRSVNYIYGSYHICSFMITLDKDAGKQTIGWLKQVVKKEIKIQIYYFHSSDKLKRLMSEYSDIADAIILNNTPMTKMPRFSRYELYYVGAEEEGEVDFGALHQTGSKNVFYLNSIAYVMFKMLGMRIKEILL